jgi:hypothetical protein
VQQVAARLRRRFDHGQSVCPGVRPWPCTRRCPL